MGTRDLPERELIQGLIKLAAAFVHAARGNPAGIGKNLRGAMAHLVEGLAAGEQLGVDMPALVAAISDRLGQEPGVGDPSIPIPRTGTSG